MTTWVCLIIPHFLSWPRLVLKCIYAIHHFIHINRDRKTLYQSGKSTTQGHGMQTQSPLLKKKVKPSGHGVRSCEPCTGTSTCEESQSFLREMRTLNRVPGMRTLSPVPGMRTLSPVHGMRTLSPLPGMLTLSPVPGMLTLSPVPGMLTLSPVRGMLTLSPVPGMLTLSPVPGMLTLSPVPLDANPEPCTWDANPEPYTPGMRTLSPVPGMRTLSPVPGMGTLSLPVPGMRILSPCIPGMRMECWRGAGCEMMRRMAALWRCWPPSPAWRFRFPCWRHVDSRLTQTPSCVSHVN